MLILCRPQAPCGSWSLNGVWAWCVHLVLVLVLVPAEQMGKYG